MKKIALALILSAGLLCLFQSCRSSKLCPAYNSYPEARGGRR